MGYDVAALASAEDHLSSALEGRVGLWSIGMRTPRRGFLKMVASAATLPSWSRIAGAQNYPIRAVRWVVGFPPGGPNDITARIMAEFLSDRLHQQFAVENHPGAASNIATESVVRSQPDGYTVLELATVNAINASLYENLNYDITRDVVLVAGIGQSPAVMEVNPNVPASTVPEFIAYAKANPGKINMGSAGIGTPPHVIGELFKMMTGVNMIHVPYHGAAPELTDLITGQIQVSFDPIQGSIGYIERGMLRPLAVTSAARTDALPDVPTIGEFVPGFEARTWQGLGAPAGTPAQITEILNHEVNDVLADPRLKAQFLHLGITPMPMTPTECQRFITAETQKWAKVIKFAGIKPE
jgi:tripartite-type tricarboxylate transporter receptor subunit TctC